MSLLEHLLRGVKRGVRELTLDCSEMTDSQRRHVVAKAESLGLHVSGMRRWILVRQL